MSISTNSKKRFPGHVVPGFLWGWMARLRAYAADRERMAVLVSRLALILCPTATFYLFDLYTHNPFTDMKFQTQVLNMVFYELTAVLLYGLFGRLRPALMLQSGLFMGLGLANYYVLQFRSAPIMPWDIYSLSTAASVADNFDYSLSKDTLLVIAGFVILLLLESRIRLKTKRKKAVRLFLVGLPVVLLYGYTAMIQSDSFVADFGLYDKLFTPTVINKRDGNAVAFIMEMEYLNVKKPQGYSANAAKQLYEEQGSEGLTAAIEDPESLNRPNLIVIMDEAFSDLGVLGEFETNEDYMPFIHSLQEDENTITGYLNVSVLGGNTANTEFEFLTGNSMAFLPQGSVAYQQYLKNEVPTLASYLKSLGYSTIAMHPYYADGWERDRVYPLMGFEEFLSKDDFPRAKKIRKYISDEACFEKIIELYEEKQVGEPLFVFNVTMQNHSGYDEAFENFTSDITVEGVHSKALSQYLSLIHETDRAFEELVDYFSRQEEDTMIVFFGDHQPTAYVSNPIIRNNGKDPESLSLEENLLKYKVPYVIWSNFEMQDTKGQETSANYLAVDVLEHCGLPLTQYHTFLKELREEYPVISAQQTCEEQKGEEAILSYQRLQYYLLFDYEEAVEEESGER